MRGNRAPAFFLALILIKGSASGQGSEAPPPRIFLNSDPIGAEVVDQAGSLLGLTPLILSPGEAGLTPGASRRLRLRKPEYADAELRIDVPSAGFARYLVPLAPLRAGVRLGDYEGDVGFLLDYGSLDLFLDEDEGFPAPRIRPRYPRQDFLAGVRVALPFFLGVSALLAASDIAAPREYGLPISWELAASTLVTAGLFGTDLWLSRDRRRFLDSGEPPKEGWLETRSGAARALAESRALMDAGASRQAADILESLLSVFPDSVQAPEATYLLGRMALLEGEPEAAAARFRRVVEELPAAEVYDKACKGLADARAVQGEIAGALEALDKMAFLDPSYPPRIIDLYRIQLRGYPDQRP